MRDGIAAGIEELRVDAVAALVRRGPGNGVSAAAERRDHGLDLQGRGIVEACGSAGIADVQNLAVLRLIVHLEVNRSDGHGSGRVGHGVRERIRPGVTFAGDVAVGAVRIEGDVSVFRLRLQGECEARSCIIDVFGRESSFHIQPLG